MKKILLAMFALIIANSLSLSAFANAKIGEKAPEFSVVDSSGKVQKLSDHQGKIVVLEWYNKDCPYVRKHYDANNMQKLQSDLTGQGAIWLTVVSSRVGKQGHQSAADTVVNTKKENAKPTAVLLDEDGKMGKAYGAKTTPHIYVIDEKGILRYNGAIDSNSSADPATIATAENYLTAAFASVKKGEAVAKATTKPYGCSVKY